MVAWQNWILPAVMGLLVLLMMRHWRNVRERLERRRLEEDDRTAIPRWGKGDAVVSADDKGAKEALRKASFDRETIDDGPLELRRWQTELQESARQLQAELDAKMALLAERINEARREADRLERAIAAAERGGPSLEPASQQGTLPSATSYPSAYERVQSLRDRAYRLADLGHSASSIAAQLGASVGDIELLLSSRAAAETDRA